VPEFKGFDPDCLKFLRELEANNNRDWFQANKQRYETLVLEPALDFIATMAPHIHKLSDRFEAIPKRTGGSLMRVYRDTRFGKDKTPYKTNIGIQFRHELGKDVHAPGYYMHMDPGECFVGVGMWHPESAALASVRNRIVEKPEEWRRATSGKSFRDVYAREGDSLKRPPRGFEAEHKYIDDLKRKDHIAVTRFSQTEVTSPEFVRSIAKRFKAGTPFMAFLCAAYGVGY